MNLKRKITESSFGRRGHAQTWHNWLGYTQKHDNAFLHLSWWLNMKNWFQDFRGLMFGKSFDCSFECKQIPVEFEGILKRNRHYRCWVCSELNNSQINCRTNWDTRKRDWRKSLQRPSTSPSCRVIFHQFFTCRTRLMSENLLWFAQSVFIGSPFFPKLICIKRKKYRRPLIPTMMNTNWRLTMHWIGSRDQ